MGLSLALDVLVAVLLMITIGYAVVLNRRLAALRKDKDELERLADKFGQNITKAEESVRRLRGGADRIGVDLEPRVEKATGLRDDLTFLIDKGESLADRLEALVRSARDHVGTRPPPPAEPMTVEGEPVASPARGRKPRQEPMPEPRGVEPRGIEPRGLDEAEGKSRDSELNARSEAERELLRALNSVR